MKGNAMRIRMFSLLLALAISLGAGAAGALTINSATVGDGFGCLNAPACTTQTHSYGGTAGTGGGTITITPSTLTFDILVDSSSFTAILGGASNTTFTGTTYSGMVSVNTTVFPTFMLHTVVPGAVTVAGTATGSGSTAFSAAASISGTCTESGVTLACGLVFSFINSDVGSVAGGDAFVHTVNLSAVPEPAAALLIGLALAGLAVRREA
jgi:hypothetical protein